MDKILLEIYKKRHPRRYIAKHSRFTRKGRRKVASNQIKVKKEKKEKSLYDGEMEDGFW